MNDQMEYLWIFLLQLGCPLVPHLFNVRIEKLRVTTTTTKLNSQKKPFKNNIDLF
jgi:hypothetical protein